MSTATLDWLTKMFSDPGLAARGSGVGILVAMTLVSLAPAILISLTSFTRITIVLAFLRQGIGMQGVPPNPVMAGLAFFLTLFSMAPTFDAVHTRALDPLLKGRLTPIEAANAALEPIRDFMLRQTRPADLLVMARLSDGPRPRTPADIRLAPLAAAFLLSELKTAFQIGVVILLPFLLVDLLVAVTVTSLGLTGLSPQAAGLPLKLALFVGVDGWNLVASSLLRTFR
jgi:flagellar biosynthetic protein FliP